MDDLSAEIARRRRIVKPLQRRRDNLAAKIADIDRQLEAMGVDADGPAPRGRRVGSSGRGSNKTSLVESLRGVLKGRVLSTSEAIEAVRKAGYKSASKNFRVMVNIALGRKKFFRRVERGRYTAK